MNHQIFLFIALFLAFTVLFWLIRDKFSIRSVWDAVVAKYRDSVSKRIDTESDFVHRYGSNENHSFLYRLDRLLLTSGLKAKIPKASGETYFMTLLLVAGAGFAEGIAISGNFFVALFLAAGQYVLLYVIVLAMSSRVYDQIEDSTPVFISILSNHSKGSSDIVTIFHRTEPSVSGPLKGLVDAFLTNAEQSGSTDMAFDYMKDSIDNRQLQTIIVNLKNCSHYQANYEEVLSQIMGQVTSNLSARENRKNALYSMRVTLALISVVALVIVWIISAGLGIDMKTALTTHMVGEALLCMTGFLYLFVLLKMFSTDK